MTIKLLLLGGSLLTRPVCYTQNGTVFTKSTEQCPLTDFVVVNNYYNLNGISQNSVRKVDSISHTGGISNYFAGMYNKVMQRIAIQLQERDSVQKRFIVKFETSFADYFLRGCENEKKGDLSSSPEWQCYFSAHDVQSWQQILLGINAHTNGDFWQALVNNFSGEEIKKNKKQLLAFQPSIAKEYWPFFEQIAIQSGYLKFINSVTNGIVEKLGERIIYKWRRRQVNLAILYYHDPEKFKKRLKVINRKKNRIDKVILNKRKFL